MDAQGGVWATTAAQAGADLRRAAAAVASSGARAGDRIGLVTTSSPGFLAIVCGALRIGVVPVVVNPVLLEHEQALILDDADCRFVLRDGEVDAFVASASASGGSGSIPELAPVPLARPMHYTSGTTGRPKGVWSGVLDEADATALWGEEIAQWGLGAGDCYLSAAPLHHSAPLRFAVATLLAGGSVVGLGSFDAGRAAQVIAGTRPTVTFVAPAALARLLELVEPPSLDGFRLITHAGAACPPALKRKAIARFPSGSVWEFYGSTEGQFTACSSAEWERRPGTVGRARAHRELSVGSDGVIWCRVPRYARFEYWRDDERTAAAWRDDAFTVFDLGRLDDCGYLYLDGRRDDLIISGSVNVYPAEVEAVLAEAPGVRDVAVFGLPDERWGQRVCAVVVGDVDIAEIAAHARASLAPFKRPKAIYRSDADLPRTAMGKLRRLDLADRLGYTAPSWRST